MKRFVIPVILRGIGGESSSTVIMKQQLMKPQTIQMIRNITSKAPSSPIIQSSHCLTAHPGCWNVKKSNNSHNNSNVFVRHISIFPSSYSKITEIEEVVGNEALEKAPARDPAKDRSVAIPVEVSMKYLESNAYKETYGDVPIWVPYRRNFKGQFAPSSTRRTCIRGGVISTGNPCPICRDEYLVLHYKNVKLLKQFISPYNGKVLHWDKTGLCRQKELELLVELEKAKDYGTISFDVPIREYDYDMYYK